MWLPATPGWGPLVLLGGGPLPLLAEVRWFVGRGGGGWPLASGCGSLVGVPSPLLAEGGPGCGPLPLRAGGFRWCWWWVTPCHSWLRVVGAVPSLSWVGSSGRGGGRFRGVGWGLGGGFPVLCVFVARRVRVVSVLVCVLWFEA